MCDLAFSPDGSTLAVVDDRDAVHLLDAVTGASRGKWDLPDAGGVTRVAFAPEGRHLAVAGRQGTVHVLRIAQRPR